MTPKQEAFVREYMVDRSVAEAADRAEYDWPTDATGFYVYFLIDADEIFYVGKGKGRRIKCHRNRTSTDNHVKATRVETAMLTGQYVERLFASDLSEAAALRLERKIIVELREAGLTNIASGNVHPLESQLARIDANSAGIRPFDQWCAIAPDYARDFAVNRYGSMRAFYDWFTNRWSELREACVAEIEGVKARA
jgi:hypothetical protein